MKRIFATITIAVSVSLPALAQKVTFYSAEFEEGVKIHLGLSEEDNVLQTQTDTITSISLSALGIKDIRDVIYLPNLKELDLSYNDFSDVQPLIQLDSLHYIDLKGNGLEDINILSFINSDSVLIDVSYNYIEDFSGFFLPAPHTIQLIGVAQQQKKNAPFFDIYQLYVDINVEGKPEAFYRGYTNLAAGITLACGSVNEPAILDGNTNSIILPSDLGAATKVILSNGERGDTTWVVPPQTLQVAAGEALTIETGLPEKYTIGSAYAISGTAVIDGTHLNYTAPADFEFDYLYVTYYEGQRLRGFTTYLIQKGDATAVLAGDVNGDGRVTPADAIMILYHYFNVVQTVFNVKAADLNNDGHITPADAIETLYKYFNSGNNARAIRPKLEELRVPE